jgi:hypothetical protein
MARDRSLPRGSSRAFDSGGVFRAESPGVSVRDSVAFEETENHQPTNNLKASAVLPPSHDYPDTNSVDASSCQAANSSLAATSNFSSSKTLKPAPTSTPSATFSPSVSFSETAAHLPSRGPDVSIPQPDSPTFHSSAEFPLSDRLFAGSLLLHATDLDATRPVPDSRPHPNSFTLTRSQT